MATTGKIRSNAIGVYISNTAVPNTGTAPTGATYGDNAWEDDTFELIACATSGTFAGSREVIDATTKDNDGRREILAGGSSWTVSAEGLIEYGLGSTVRSNADLFDLWNNNTKVRLAWTTGVDGDVMYYGNAFITSYEESAATNEVASYSVTFEGDGSITKAIIGAATTFNNNND